MYAYFVSEVSEHGLVLIVIAGGVVIVANRLFLCDVVIVSNRLFLADHGVVALCRCFRRPANTDGIASFFRHF